MCVSGREARLKEAGGSLESRNLGVVCLICYPQGLREFLA